MIRVTSAVPEDFDKFEPMPIFEQEKPFLYRLKDACDRLDSVAHTFWVEGEAIGCIGATLGGDKVMTIWAWLSDKIKKYPLEFSKKCILALRFYIKAFSPEAVHLYVKKDADDVVRWGKFLGFRKTVIVKGDDGVEYFKMVRGV